MPSPLVTLHAYTVESFVCYNWSILTLLLYIAYMQCAIYTVYFAQYLQICKWFERMSVTNPVSAISPSEGSTTIQSIFHQIPFLIIPCIGTDYRLTCFPSVDYLSSTHTHTLTAKYCILVSCSLVSLALSALFFALSCRVFDLGLFTLCFCNCCLPWPLPVSGILFCLALHCCLLVEDPTCSDYALFK